MFLKTENKGETDISGIILNSVSLHKFKFVLEFILLATVCNLFTLEMQIMLSLCISRKLESVTSSTSQVLFIKLRFQLVSQGLIATLMEMVNSLGSFG